jgi:hypothetical protein
MFLLTRQASLYNAYCEMSLLITHIPNLLYLARVVKLVDTTDLKSVGWKRLYRFKSGPGHQTINNLQIFLATVTTSHISNQRGSMNYFDVEIKCNDQIFKAVAKINSDSLTVSAVNLRPKSTGNDSTSTHGTAWK